MPPNDSQAPPPSRPPLTRAERAVLVVFLLVIAYAGYVLFTTTIPPIQPHHPSPSAAPASARGV